MIAELDIGNSRCKWRLLSPEGIACRGEGFSELLDRLLLLGPVEAVRLCSVLSQDKTQRLIDQLQSVVKAPVHVAQSTARCGAVVNGYIDPQQLGVDRWLAIIAGWYMARRDVLVVDIGSALTMDLIDHEGRHRGGYIIPGPSLLSDSLLRRTDRVRFEGEGALVLNTLQPGQDTQHCVGAGIAAATVGSILAAHQNARDELQSDAEILLCGGYSSSVLELLACATGARCRQVPDLVLDGLRWVIPLAAPPDRI